MVTVDMSLLRSYNCRNIVWVVEDVLSGEGWRHRGEGSFGGDSLRFSTRSESKTNGGAMMECRRRGIISFQTD